MERDQIRASDLDPETIEPSVGKQIKSEKTMTKQGQQVATTKRINLMMAEIKARVNAQSEMEAETETNAEVTQHAMPAARVNPNTPRQARMEARGGGGDPGQYSQHLSVCVVR